MFYHAVLFFCSKRCHIKYNTLFHHENKQQNRIKKKTAADHSADIDYQNFKKIYRECAKETFNFLTIDTTLPASNPFRFRKNLFESYKNDSNLSDQNFKQKDHTK